MESKKVVLEKHEGNTLKHIWKEVDKQVENEI